MTRVIKVPPRDVAAAKAAFAQLLRSSALRKVLRS